MTGKPLDETSVVLLKPDGYSSTPIRSMVHELLARNGLREELRYTMVLDEEDVLDVWPRFASTKYPLSRLLTCLYMTSGPSEVMIVHGPSAASRAHRIKTEVRSVHGAGMFANAIHTPSGPIEVAGALDKFRDCVPKGVPYMRHTYPEQTDGIWGRLAAVGVVELGAAVTRIWSRRDEQGWAALRRMGQAPPVTLLHGGDPHSIDYGMSALAHIFPSWDFDEVIRAYLEADVFGEAILCTGSRSEVDCVRDMLLALGLNASSH